MLTPLLIFAAAADTASVPQAPPIVIQGEKPREQRRVCSMETPTGSLFAKRICRTVVEIETNRQQSAKLMDEAGRIPGLQMYRDFPSPKN